MARQPVISDLILHIVVSFLPCRATFAGFPAPSVEETTGKSLLPAPHHSAGLTRSTVLAHIDKLLAITYTIMMTLADPQHALLFGPAGASHSTGLTMLQRVLALW